MNFKADRSERLDRFLARVLPAYSRTKLAEHIALGGVLVDGSARKPSFGLEPGMSVAVGAIEEPAMHELQAVPLPLKVVYEDEHLLVIDKPAGLSVHPSSTSHENTLVHALLAYSQDLSQVGGSFRPGIVHRLDKDTSGLMLVAKNDAVHRALQSAIQERRVTRVYKAWVKGKPDKDAFTIKTYLGRNPKNRKKMTVVTESAPDARLAITHCEVNNSAQGVTVLECKLETGRTHQIRVHLASVGLPVLGDKTYGVSWPGLERQALHASRLSFEHPITSAPLGFESPVPDDIGRILP